MPRSRPVLMPGPARTPPGPRLDRKDGDEGPVVVAPRRSRRSERAALPCPSRSSPSSRASPPLSGCGNASSRPRLAPGLPLPGRRRAGSGSPSDSRPGTGSAVWSGLGAGSPVSPKPGSPARLRTRAARRSEERPKAFASSMQPMVGRGGSGLGSEGGGGVCGFGRRCGGMS